MKTLTRDISWLACGQTAVRGAQITVALGLVHVLPSAEWNALALAMSVYFVGVTVGSLNLEHSVLGLLPQIKCSHQRVFLTQTMHFLTVTAIIAGSIIMLAELSLHFLDGLKVAILLALAVVLEIPAVIGSAAFIARDQTRSAGLWDILSAVGFLTAAFVPAVVHGTAAAVLAGLAVYGAFRFVAFTVVLCTTPADPLAKPIQGLVKSQIAFCAPLGISLALGTLTRAVDKWIVAWHVPDAIGAYAIAAQELPLLAVLPYAGGAAITTQLVRHLANNDPSSALNLWRNQAEALCAPVVSLSLATAVVAPEIFDIFLPSAPVGAAASFAIFSLIGVHRVTEYGVVLRAANQNRHIAGSAAIVLVGCVAFGVIGAHLGGIVGVSLGTAFAFGIGWVWILDKIATTLRSSIAEVFPWAKWWRAMNAAVTAGAAAFVAAEIVTAPTHRLLVKVVAFALTLRLFRRTGTSSVGAVTA